MQHPSINIKLAQTFFELNFHFEATKEYFIKYKVPQKNSFTDKKKIIMLKPEEIDSLELYSEDSILTPFAEYNELIFPVSEALMEEKCCCFHSLAFLWQDKAFLFMGRSGIGKSTQYKNWKALYPDEIEILNGDKPVLQFRENGEIWVYPSPWTGKEKWGSKRIAQLGGIIYLSWNDINTIKRMEYKDAVYPVLQQIFHRTYTEKNCHIIARMTETIISTIPIWNLDNRGDLESSRLTHEFLLKQL